ncbi:hypothetical protein FOG51_01608 [Hanseniaspora uvarum]|jgi:prefoldin subunit 5|uniref:Prefoldin subunit 3 n=1 Tax=Hanseniaspora uvarum TaxID=29833 RepID=A0A1E5R4B6_HANUV|nr:hypothetical protein FOG48_00057 [Hanseniaspora uvarum]KKA02280.1 Prefoldin subunit 3 [Hanseniaspora uvarum DSM 2768]KAF0273362.1 hypothetical protein FOG51_01608 [Hanseniaspora uvarum]KAF0278320.1 hypothetical protein FOG50_00803 [Hanseniaspora uvarum]OEJ81757.1 Prefoldin subunit 3 [Hanseniaspora uvarum]
MSTAKPDLKDVNPRGIPKALFIDLNDTKITSNLELTVANVQQNLQKYEYMLKSKDQQLKSITDITKDIKTNSKVIDTLIAQNADDSDDEDGEFQDIQYELEDGLFAFASIPKKSTTNTVSLWLGSGILMEFTYEEAQQILSEKSAVYTNKINEIMEDIEFLREQITTLQVNMSKVYNYSILQKRKLEQQQSVKA